MLSNGARILTGGVPEVGRGASGRSNTSVPFALTKLIRPGRSLSKTSASLVRPDHAWASFTLAGPKAAR